nr:hypothetical protein BaRGS_008652 [Batillaria attramentaria]
MDALEAENQALKAENQAMKTHISSLLTDVSTLQAENQVLVQNVSQLQADSVAMVTQTARDQTDVETVKADSNVIRQELETLRQDNVNAKTEFTSMINAVAKSVSFHSLMDKGPYNESDTLTGDLTYTNDGNAHDETSGVFTVPVSGTYIFLANIDDNTASSRGTHRNFDIYVDGSELKADSVAMVTQTARVQTDVETVKADSNVIRQELETLRQDNVNVKTDLTAKLSTGMFTVPVSGTYIFVATITVDHASSRRINDEVLIYVDARAVSSCSSSYTDHNEPGSCHAILKLRAGQRVWLRNYSDGTRQLKTDSVAMVTQTARVQTDVETVKADSNVIRQELETLRQDNVKVKTDLTSKISNHTFTNDGNAYDENSGVFTVPVSGTYVFLVTVTVDSASEKLTNDVVRVFVDGIYA